LQQRRRTGDIAPRHRYSGRKPFILGSHHRQMQTMLGRKPDLTLKELRAAMQLKCTLPAIHYALEKLGLTYKKRHSAPVSRTVQTSPGRVGSGGAGRQVLTRPV
jgi:transposase